MAPRRLLFLAIRFTGAIPLLWPAFISHSTPDLQFRKQFKLQAGLYARTPVQSDRCSLNRINYYLESNPERHENATGSSHWEQI